MGNATKPRKPTPRRNTNLVERQMNAIRRRISQIKNEATALKNAFERIREKIKPSIYDEQDIAVMQLIRQLMRELVAEKNALDAAHARLLQHQITYGF